jgi:hypothetical protein
LFLISLTRLLLTSRTRLHYTFSDKRRPAKPDDDLEFYKEPVEESSEEEAQSEDDFVDQDYDDDDDDGTSELDKKLKQELARHIRKEQEAERVAAKLKKTKLDIAEVAENILMDPNRHVSTADNDDDDVILCLFFLFLSCLALPCLSLLLYSISCFK